MFIKRKEFEALISRIDELETKVNAIPDSGYTVYEDCTIRSLRYLWPPKGKTFTAGQMFNLIFEKLGVRPKYVEGVEPRIELEALKKK